MPEQRRTAIIDIQQDRPLASIYRASKYLPWEVEEWLALHCKRVASVAWVNVVRSEPPPAWLKKRFPGYVMGDLGAIVISYEPMDLAGHMRTYSRGELAQR